MWYLEEFDKETQSKLKDYPLLNISTEIVKQILEVEDDDYDLPVGVRQNDVPLSKAPKFAPYVSGTFEVDKNHEYEVAFLAD